jgi:hypothetical protein
MKDGDVPLKKGRLAFDCKTNGEIDIVTPDQFERLNELDPRGYKRRGGGFDEA